MDKREFIKKVDQAIITEEDAIPVYSRHLKTIIFWSGLGEEKEKRIKAYLDVLINDTRKHIRIFESIKKFVK